MIYRAKQCMKGIAQLLQFHEIFPLEQFWTFLRNPLFNLLPNEILFPPSV